MAECFSTQTVRRQHGSPATLGLSIIIGYDEEAFSYLTIFQCSKVSAQISAKVHGPFRARKKIIGERDPAGEPARALRDAGSFELAHFYSGNGIVLEPAAIFDPAASRTTTA